MPDRNKRIFQVLSGPEDICERAANIIHPIGTRDIRRSEGNDDVGAVRGAAQSSPASNRYDRITGALTSPEGSRSEFKRPRTGYRSAVNARQVLLGSVIVSRKATTENNEIILLHRETRDEVIGSIAKVNCRIHRSIQIQADNVIANQPVEPRKFPAQKNPRIG